MKHKKLLYNLIYYLFFCFIRQFTSRVTYDLFFFVIIIVLLLNIIFGIIIDTFGQLREDASERNRLITEYCFTCGIAKDVFDDIGYTKKDQKGPSGGGSNTYTDHIKQEHNMWDYMFFLIYLKAKNPNDYFGIER
jgi:inositol 1,4,5-triphosphate receptor type 1